MIKKIIAAVLFTLLSSQTLSANTALELLLSNSGKSLTDSASIQKNTLKTPKPEKKRPTEKEKPPLQLSDLSKIEVQFYNQALYLYELEHPPTTTQTAPTENPSQIPEPAPTPPAYTRYNSTHTFPPPMTQPLVQKQENLPELDPEPKTALIPELILYQYGYDLFNNQTTSYANQMDYVPVSDDYILGPGDTLIVRIWGKLEETIEEQIDQNGNLNLPKVGHITLSGTKFKQAKKIIKKSFSRQFVNIDISITMGQLKTIKIFVLGEVNQPGAYHISSMSSLMTALYTAGGPKKTGSLRHIEIRQKNKKNKVIDLYQYIIKGKQSQDPGLSANDTIYIPPIGNVIKINGAIKKPAIYELKKSESIQNLIKDYAGGFSAHANNALISIQRPENGLSLVKTINTEKNKKALSSTLLKNGDSIHIQAANLNAINGIVVLGEANNPGLFEYTPSLTLDQLLTQAHGFNDKALQTLIKISRLNPDGSRTDQFISKEKTPQFILEKRDIVSILNRSDYYKDRTVEIEGAVKETGQYPFSENMKLSDLLLAAKLSPQAELSNVEVFRSNAEKNTIHTINTTSIISNRNNTQNITLKENDIITIRYKKNTQTTKRITLTGEVHYPGLYLATNTDTLETIIKRAGGFTSYAFVNGAILKRENSKNQEASGYKQVLNDEKKRIIFDQTRLSRMPEGAQFLYQNSLKFIQEKIHESEGRVVFNISNTQLKVEDGDTLHIPETPNFIQVVGGVNNPTGLLYIKNKSARHYIKQAGNYSNFAQKNAIYIFKTNGSVSKNTKHIERGDTIYVTEKIQLNWVDSLTRSLDILVKSLTVIALLNST